MISKKQTFLPELEVSLIPHIEGKVERLKR